MKISDISVEGFREQETRLHVPPYFRRGHLRGGERASIESAINNLRAISEKTDRPDWTNLRVLDYGCGVKFTQALVGLVRFW
ncbi:hypothetical protein [Synechococcus sp. PCC 7336]|uniref:hypothetical protein n=1 Tax=Synechococcus sp. PCC 7336 TaxID=195250 RepID=UPI0003450212|nr:hypothetical protein [Synechococcus sp. PCC 7336]